MKRCFLLSLFAFSCAAAGAAETPAVPELAKLPPMDGSFREADWSKALKLDGFTLKGGGAAAEPTAVYLCRDRNTLYGAIAMDGEDVAALIPKQENDRLKAPWALPGVECMFGSSDAALQLAFDYMGRVYSDLDKLFYVTAGWTANRVTVRFALPLEIVPRDRASDYIVRMNFYRKSAGGLSSWVPNDTSLIRDMSKTREVYLAPADKVAADVKARAEAKAALAAKGGAMAAKYGTFRPVVPAEAFDTPPRLWKPADMHGRDYWYAVPVAPYVYRDFEETGMIDEPFVREALLWMRWERATEELLPEDGFYRKIAAAHPGVPIAIKGMDRLHLSAEEKKRPDIYRYWDKEFIGRFLDAYGDRFVGFWEDEAFVCGTGVFAEYLRDFNLPKPKNRDEAYACFGKFYNMQFDEIPDTTPFRNVANASPYTHTYAANVAAGTFNHFVLALGDRLSGNETGDCMGPNPPKFAIARGAARQFLKPWRNYQTYYAWQYQESRSSGGMRCITGSRHLLTPECRFYQYGFSNGPDVGLDLARQKNTYIYPYICGCGVWSSEANHEELVAYYDPEEIKTADPLVVNLRDEKKYMSEMAKIHKHFYDEIVKKRDRGVSVTPVGVVWDRANGYVPLYFGNQVWDFFPPNELEQTMWPFNTHVFKPCKQNPYYATCAYGDVFDILTNDASEDFLKTYPVLYPMGDVTIDGVFAAKLQNYVKDGGTLVLNAALLLKYPGFFPVDFLGAKIASGTKTSAGTYSRLTSKIVLEESPYVYCPLEPAAGTEALAVTADDSETPVITLHRVGKGRVILTAPENMKVKGSLEKMLNLFDDFMGALRDDVLALRVRTEMEYAVNRSKTSWLVYLNNNFGIPPAGGVFKTPPKTDTSKTAAARIEVPDSLGGVKKVIDWWSGRELEFRIQQATGGKCAVAEFSLPGGDCAVLEFVMK